MGRSCGTRLAGCGFAWMPRWQGGARGHGLRLGAQGEWEEAGQVEPEQNFSRKQAFDGFAIDSTAKSERSSHLACASGSSKPVCCNTLSDAYNSVVTGEGEVFLQRLGRSGRFREARLFVSGHITEVLGLL